MMIVLAIILSSPHLAFSLSGMTDLGPSLHQALSFSATWRGMNDLYTWINWRSLCRVLTSSMSRTRELTYLSWRALILPALSPKPLSVYLCPIAFQSTFSFPFLCVTLDMSFSLCNFSQLLFSSGMRELRASAILPGCCPVSSSSWSPAVAASLGVAWFFRPNLLQLLRVASCLAGHTSVKCFSLGGNNTPHPFPPPES